MYIYTLSFETISNVQKNYQYNTKKFFLSHFRICCWYERPQMNHSENLFSPWVSRKGGEGVAAMEMACLSKQENPKCLRSHEAEKDAAEGSQTRSPWEELTPGGCLERPGDHRRGWACESREGWQFIISHLLKEALPTARSLTVGEKFLAKGASPIKTTKEPTKKGKSAFGFCPTQRPKLYYSCTRQARAFVPLSSFPLPTLQPRRGPGGRGMRSRVRKWGNWPRPLPTTPHPHPAPRCQTSAKPQVQRRLIIWMRFRAGLDFSLECDQ